MYPERSGRIPKPYVAPFEVVVHDQPDDCWVSLLGKVFDVTPIIKQYEGQDCIKPLIAHAGKDISNWFDDRTGDIRYYIHPLTGAHVPYCPHGRIPDVLPQVPTVNWKPLDHPPWWKDDQYVIGPLTKRVRPIRIINSLIRKEVSMNVCCEDTFSRIMERYSMFCSNPQSYTWRYCDRTMDPSKTMEENEIPDERDRFTELGLPQNLYVPGIFLYYNDDLKEYMSDSDE